MVFNSFNTLPMKKFIATVSLLLTLTIGASAQETKPLTAVETGKSDTAKLSGIVQLTADQQLKFNDLFEIRHRLLNDKELPLGRKEELVSVMSSKIKALLTEEQFNTLNANPEFLKTLTGANVIKMPVKK